jgi:hypothetical protein
VGPTGPGPDEGAAMTAALKAPVETKGETIALHDNRERFRPTTFIWVTPAAILLIGLFLVPTIYAVYLGFTNLQLLGTRRTTPSPASPISTVWSTTRSFGTR